MGEDSAGLAGLLAAAEARMPVESAEAVAFELARSLDARSVSFLITDFTGNAVVRLGNTGVGEEREHIELPGTIYEQVLRDQRVSVRRAPDADVQVRIVAPVTNRGDAIGLLEVLLPQAPEPATVQTVADAAHALAYILIANRRFTDLYQWGRRTLPVSLAAEIQNTLLPDSLTCEAPQFTVSGELIPAEMIAGDTFDHSLDRHTLHVSITDAMGHNVRAALMATLLVGALRSARRSGADLAEQARQAHQALLDHGVLGSLVTGQLLRIDLRTGSADFVNAGHPWPWRLRGGRLDHITPEIDPPFGAPLPHPHRVQSLQLRPGDRLILVTDGMLERNAAAEDLPALIKDTRDLHPRETVHALTQAVLHAQQGVLHDDATVVCLDWKGTTN
ncbi:PP2C family protein-serine/threonine phosphatase [Streptomyces sp. NPDC019645]|uniref:PP2C family protein-serine/threonine phosphatase n=1 Tax=Streptomyces sp. NPDC019645 TaxID=3154786 RepID=UPI0033DA3FDA